MKSLAPRRAGDAHVESAAPHAKASPAPQSAESRAIALGSGRALDDQTRGAMESRFGHDFGDVRVHTGADAELTANELGAEAFTAGSHIAFADGAYAPGTSSGQRLLAHELTHVVQQRTQTERGVPLVQRKAKAVRFQDEPTLDEVSDGKKVLKQGDKGEAVIRVTVALHELGHYTIDAIDENFDIPVTTAVSKYQDAKPALKGKAPAGQVDQTTFNELDKDFSAGYTVERDVLGKQKAPNLLTHTQSIDDKERKAIAKAVSTEPPVNPITGLPPTFVPDIPLKGKYKDRLRTAVDAEIVSEYNSMGKNKAAQHADPTKLYDWPAIEAIATESKSAADNVFGEYKKGPALKKGVNIFDAWDDKVKQLTAGGKAAEDAARDWRVRKILTGDDAVKAIDREHGAIQSRAPEKAIVDKIKSDMLAKYPTELLETHKGWPGYADTGKIFIQIFKGATADRQRFDMWDFFQTFIHEYIHTLEHPDHIAYRGGLGEQKGGFTLREGTTDYFTKVVWNSITINDALRKKIEGPFHDPVNKFAIQPLNTYDESENAERLAGVVGIRNVAAAFFLGKVELIGKK